MANEYFKHPNRARQLLDFSKLKYGESMIPTDIDSYLDWSEEKYKFFIEMKYKDAPMPIGQRIAYEHIVNDCRKAGIDAFALVCEHTTEDTNETVSAEASTIREVYDGRSWTRRDEGSTWTLKNFLDYYWEKAFRQGRRRC